MLRFRAAIYAAVIAMSILAPTLEARADFTVRPLPVDLTRLPFKYRILHDSRVRVLQTFRYAGKDGTTIQTTYATPFGFLTTVQIEKPRQFTTRKSATTPTVTMHSDRTSLHIAVDFTDSITFASVPVGTVSQSLAMGLAHELL